MKYSHSRATGRRSPRSVGPPDAVGSAATAPSASRTTCSIVNVLPSPQVKAHVASASSPAGSSRRYRTVLSGAAGPAPWPIKPGRVLPAARSGAAAPAASACGRSVCRPQLPGTRGS
ncbi:hypothetical protein AMK33_21330 [Streptomyces sp. CB02400]|nr:hypothetical protein AMK33_21330 [Streptomyces sp. CB02400]